MVEARQVTSEQNIEWFGENEAYMARQSRLEHYQHAKRSVEHELHGVHRVLDVGNGGFFNYDTGIVDHVTALDLFLKDGPGPTPNSTLRGGSLLDLPFSDQSFDCILLQNVFHHITGQTPTENFANLRQSMIEIHRCLESNGKVIIIESTVGPVFQFVERMLFTLAIRLKRSGHPVTFQFTPNQIVSHGRQCGLMLEELSFVPRGAFVLQFGHKWPSLLTPVKPIKLILRRPMDTQLSRAS